MQDLKAVGTMLAKARSGVRPPGTSRVVASVAVSLTVTALALALGDRWNAYGIVDLWVPTLAASSVVSALWVYSRRDHTWVDAIRARVDQYEPLHLEAFNTMQVRVYGGQESELDVVEEWLVSEWQRATAQARAVEA